MSVFFSDIEYYKHIIYPIRRGFVDANTVTLQSLDWGSFSMESTYRRAWRALRQEIWTNIEYAMAHDLPISEPATIISRQYIVYHGYVYSASISRISNSTYNASLILPSYLPVCEVCKDTRRDAVDGLYRIFPHWSAVLDSMGVSLTSELGRNLITDFEMIDDMCLCPSSFK